MRSFHINNANTVNHHARLGFVIIVSTVLHALIISFKYPPAPDSSPIPTLEITITKAKKTATTIIHPVKKSPVNSTQPRPENISPQNKEIFAPPILPNILRDNNDSPAVTRDNNTKQEQQSTTNVTGIELLNRSIDFIRSQPPTKNAMPKLPFTSTNIKGRSSTLPDSYSSNHNSTIVRFRTAGGKVVCAEIREKDPLDELGNSTWSILANGCGE